jgi:hypothetical protein
MVSKSSTIAIVVSTDTVSWASLFCRSTHNCRAIDGPLRLGLDKEVHKGRNKRQTIAGENVFPFQLPQSRCIVFMKEGQIDIECHGEGPQGVSGHEPATWSEENPICRSKLG